MRVTGVADGRGSGRVAAGFSAIAATVAKSTNNASPSLLVSPHTQAVAVTGATVVVGTIPYRKSHPRL